MTTERLGLSGAALGQFVANCLDKTDDIPRRSKLWLLSPAERAIFDAVQAVEQSGLGGAPITEAINLLHAAFDKVADSIDANLVEWLRSQMQLPDHPDRAKSQFKQEG
jgi:hypothetical protein